jgi:precorrin-2 dehydrogenase / sirohydrochlorin ferrochelatase
MDYYPVNLNLTGKKAVIIGGGRIAERKIAGLLDTGAEITIISPEITPGILEFTKLNKVIWVQKEFSPEDIVGAFIIIAASNQSEVNTLVCESATPYQLVSSVSNHEQSNFILPSVLKQGKLNIAISTSGASPILAKKIKHKIAEDYGCDYKEYVDFLFQARQRILNEIKNPELKKLLLSAITGENFFSSQKREDDLEELLLNIKSGD